MSILGLVVASLAVGMIRVVAARKAARRHSISYGVAFAFQWTRERVWGVNAGVLTAVGVGVIVVVFFLLELREK